MLLWDRPAVVVSRSAAIKYNDFDFTGMAVIAECGEGCQRDLGKGAEMQRFGMDKWIIGLVDVLIPECGTWSAELGRHLRRLGGRLGGSPRRERIGLRPTSVYSRHRGIRRDESARQADALLTLGR